MPVAREVNDDDIDQLPVGEPVIIQGRRYWIGVALVFLGLATLIAGLSVGLTARSNNGAIHEGIPYQEISVSDDLVDAFSMLCPPRTARQRQ